MSKEFIICSAILIPDNLIHDDQPINIPSGFVICGRRHNNCYQVIRNLLGDEIEYFKQLGVTDHRKYQGFITSTNRYVNRHEGWVIAKENNQIQFGLLASENGDESELISENLY